MSENETAAWPHSPFKEQEEAAKCRDNIPLSVGIAPLPVQFDRPGRHRLLFWAPALRRRVTWVVEVGGGGPHRVSAIMGPSREIARSGDHSPG
jgi:hypothetical protein